MLIEQSVEFCYGTISLCACNHGYSVNRCGLAAGKAVANLIRSNSHVADVSLDDVHAA